MSLPTESLTTKAAPKVKKDKIVSCAECRRLKLKCDRIFPCSSCRKRGLTALCPHVALPTRPRQTSENVRSDASPSEMAARIRELEDALRSLQAIHSNQPHPLLVDHGYTTSHTPLGSGSKSSRLGSPLEDDLDGLDDSLGTLAIDLQSGKSSFFGQSAGMESLYHNELRKESDPPELQPGWPSGPFDPIRDSLPDPLYPRISSDTIMQHLEGHLPDSLRAWELCDIYYNNAAWLYSPVPRPQFQEEILTPVYSNVLPSLTDTALTHFDVSILFMVFAIGSLLDLSNPSDSGICNSSSAADPKIISDTDRYHQLARAALTVGTSALEESTVSAVRSIFLMAYYHMLLDRKQAPQKVWSLTSLAVGLAISIGLHRGSDRWKLDPSLTEQRRSLFWELYFFMTVQIALAGMAFGRPPQITLPFVDCGVGPDTEQTTTPDGTLKHGYSYRLNMITTTVLSEMSVLLLSTKQKYDDILAMDLKLRDCAVELFGGPVGDREVGPDVLKGPTTVATMQKFFLLAMKETTMMYLHRKHFVRACTSRSEDLATNRYCPSLLAAFRSAQVLIILMGSLFTLEPELPCRFWFFWSHTLASAIMVGSVAMRHPRSVLAAEAMSSLETVLEQLQRWAKQNDKVDRPTRSLKIVTQIRDKARWAMSNPESSPTEPDVPQQSDELSVLGGHPRLISTKLPPTPAHSSVSSTSTPLTADLHPSLMEDLSVFAEQDRGVCRAHSTGPSAHAAGMLESQPTTTGELYPGINVPQEYVRTAPVNMYGDVEGQGAAGDAPHPEYFLPSGGIYTQNVEAMDSFGHVFAIAPDTMLD